MLRRAFCPGKNPVQGRSQATVDAILEAAAQVLVRFGYESANTTLIAHKAGVSVGSLYQYFPNKDAVYGELLQRELTQVKSLMVEAVECQPYAGITKKIEASIVAFVNYKAKDPKLHSALKTELGRIDGSRAVKRIKQEALEVMEALLVAHSDELPLSDPKHSAFFVVNMVDGIVDAALFNLILDIETCSGQRSPSDLARWLPPTVSGLLQLAEKFERGISIGMGAAVGGSLLAIPSGELNCLFDDPL